MELSRGSLFAGYRVGRMLGRGGMGAVYLAHPEAGGDAVALKIVRPDIAADERFLRRFEREARLAATLEHPHLVPLLEAGMADGTPFLAMRYVAGTNLEDVLAAAGALHPRHATALVEQVAGALDAAHALDLVHRDVKPGNVLLETGDADVPHAYLTDFGLSKHTASTSGLTKTGHWVGTVGYAAPEQIQAQAVDARTDVYGLACVLFELLTGDVPFSSKRDIDVMTAHITEPPPVPSAVPGVPPGMDHVILRALAKDPAERYPTAGEFAADALEAAQDSPPAPPFPGPTPPAAIDGDASTAA